MPERADGHFPDYMLGLDATTTQTGVWIPMLGTWGWSCTLAIQGGANGTLYFQATDFGPQSLTGLPFAAQGAVGQDALSIVASGATYWRMGKSYDPIWNTSKWLRAYWGNNTSSAGAKIYVAFTLKHQ